MRKILLGASMIFLAGSSLAENNFDDRWYITPNVSTVIPDSDKNASSALVYGMGFGKFISEKVSVDLELDKTTLDLKTGGDLTQTSVGLLSRYHFSEKMGFRPYLGLGLGLLRHNVPSATKTTGTFAAGMNKDLTEKVKLRTEVRYRLEDSDKTVTGESSYGDYFFNAGLSVMLGNAPAQTTKTTIVEQAPQLDSDGDGVSDANDRCPNTPEGTEVDSQGCAKVDGDDDNDGVANSMDACPNSKPGAVVGKDGCEVQVVIELQGVHFDFDKSTLKPESIVILDAAVKTMGEHGTIMVEVAGHTDSIASEEYNQKLSERRAKVVYDYLVSKGVSADRMTWKGYGELQPIATNDTEEGRAQNRRTELNVK